MTVNAKNGLRYRIGATMLFESMDAEDFEKDLPLYELMHLTGYRGFQINASAHEDDYLLSLKQWADDNDSEVAAIGFLVAAGDEPACPISADADTRNRAWDQFEQHVAKAAMLGAVSAFGPYFAGLLNPQPEIWTSDHAERSIEFIRYAESIARKYHTPVELEPLNRFESPVSTLAMATELLRAGGASDWVRLGGDTCHQGFSEASTTESWDKYADMLGTTLHLSDFGRSLLGKEQALTGLGIFPFLRDWEDTPVKSLYVEAFGSDVDRGIAAALGLKVLPKATGREVMNVNFDFVAEQLSATPVMS